MPSPGTGEERRRSVRFNCAGVAKIICLPSDGTSIPATLRDLSLHGCCIEPSFPIHFGVRAEIVVRFNAASFRAVGEVKTKRDGTGAGLEFVQLSAGGKGLLVDIIADLERWRTMMGQIRSTRADSLAKTLLPELQASKLRTARALRRSLSQAQEITGEMQSVVTPGKAEDANDQSLREDRIAEIAPIIVAVDLFG